MQTPRDGEETACMYRITGDVALRCTFSRGQRGIRRMTAAQCYAFFRVVTACSTALLVTRLHRAVGLRARALLVDLVILFIHSFIHARSHPCSLSGFAE